MKFNTLLSVLLVLAVNTDLTAQIIQSDYSFGTNGIVTSDIFGKNDEIGDVAVQSDGKIIVTGSSVVQSHSEFVVVRYNDNGMIDSTFGTLGVTSKAFGAANSEATAVEIQSDGKIVVCGNYDQNFYNDPAVMRLNSDGTIDSTFGVNGTVEYIFSNQFDEFHDLAIKSDGRILLAGRTFYNNTYDFLLVQLLSDGSLDSTFGTNGIARVDVGNSYDCIFSIGFVANDKIFITGIKDLGSVYFTAARFHSNGSIDMQFGTNGFAVFGSGNRVDECNAFAIQSDSSIVLAGKHHNSNIDEYMVVRLQKDGAVDSTFGNNGVVLLPTTNSNDAFNDLCIQYDGRILLAGSGVGQQPIITRLNSDGAVDNTFGNNGTFAANTGSSVNSLFVIRMLQDSTILSAGFTYNGVDNDFLLSKALVDYTSGLGETIERNALNVYPNPANDYINASLPLVVEEPGIISVYDAAYNVVLFHRFAFLYSPFTVGLPVLKPGIYYLNISSGSISYSKSFLVQH